jgi:uncharacterized membrane protein YfcA
MINSFELNLLIWEGATFKSDSISESPHKDLWPPEGTEGIGYVLMFFVSALANAAGIGGGSIMTPVLVLLFYFETRTAVPLSQVIIFAGAIVAIALKFKNRHPRRDRPLIFYELIVLVQAPILLGTFFGALLNAIFPSWMIELILTSVLGFMFYTTLQKAMILYRKESKMISNEPLLGGKPKEDIRYSIAESAQSSNQLESKQLTAILEKEKSPLPLKNFLIIVGIWVIVVLFTLMKGGSVPSIVGIKECSHEYFGLITLFVFTLGLIFMYNLHQAVKSTEQKDAVGYNWDEYDIKWTKKNAFTVGVLSIMIGFVAGLIGIAGGLMLIPMMLSYGVGPEQAAATSSFTVVFTASIAILHYISSGLLNFQYAVAVFSVSFCGAYTGITLVKKIIEKYQRPSIIVFILAFLMAVVVTLVPSYGITNLIQDYNDGTAEFGFKDLCKRSEL